MYMQDAVAWAGGRGMESKKLLENEKRKRNTEFRHMWTSNNDFIFSNRFLRYRWQLFQHFLVSNTLICALIHCPAFLNTYSPVKVNIQEQTGNSPVLLDETGSFQNTKPLLWLSMLFSLGTTLKTNNNFKFYYWWLFTAD